MWWTPWDSATACSMRIEGLLLEGFRNYDSQQLTFDESCNVIYGDNAQGKTNLLEAIVYLSCGRSPRTHADRELIGFGTDRARLVGQIRSREREFETEIQLTRGRRRKMTVNGVAAKNGGDLSKPVYYGDNAISSLTDNGLGIIGNLSRLKYKDTPYVVSEWNSAWLGKNYTEDYLLMATYGARQNCNPIAYNYAENEPARGGK